jgi:hypothetical protein
MRKLDVAHRHTRAYWADASLDWMGTSLGLGHQGVNKGRGTGVVPVHRSVEFVHFVECDPDRFGHGKSYGLQIGTFVFAFIASHLAR